MTLKEATHATRKQIANKNAKGLLPQIVTNKVEKKEVQRTYNYILLGSSPFLCIFIRNF